MSDIRHYYMTDSRDRGISQSAFENPGLYIPIPPHMDCLIQTDISSQQNYWSVLSQCFC